MNYRLIISTIVEALSRNGALKMEALYKEVNKLHGNIDVKFFEKTLMTMELQGLISVSNKTRGQRRIELVKE